MWEYLKRRRYPASLLAMLVCGALFGGTLLWEARLSLFGTVLLYSLSVYGFWCALWLLCGGLRGLISGAYYGFWPFDAVLLSAFFQGALGWEFPRYILIPLAVIPMVGLLPRMNALRDRLAPPDDARLNGREMTAEEEGWEDEELEEGDGEAFPDPPWLASYREGNRQTFFDLSLTDGDFPAMRQLFSRRMELELPINSEEVEPDSRSAALLQKLLDWLGKEGAVLLAGLQLDYGRGRAVLSFYYQPREGYRLAGKARSFFRRRRVPVTLRSQQDTEWAFLREELTPEERRLFRLRNERLARGLEEQGVDIYKPRPIAFFVWVEKQEALIPCGTALLDGGFIPFSTRRDGEGYEMDFTRRLKPSQESLDAAVDWLMTALEPYEGRFRGVLL